MGEISASIVTYHSDKTALADCMSSLSKAVKALPAHEKCHVYLIDNGGGPGDCSSLFGADSSLIINQISGHGNVGFGRGHDMGINQTGSACHLILNPDVELAPDALVNALSFMRAHPECVLLTPRAKWPDGSTQYLCKRMPTVLDLFLRGFAPVWLKRRFQTRLARYEMQDLTGDEVLWDPPVISGCFMLFRTAVLKQLGGFGQKYLLYFEDFDLSLRTAAAGRIAYVPAVRIVHHGGNAARKGWRHVWLFVRSAIIFFNTYGWKWW